MALIIKYRIFVNEVCNRFRERLRLRGRLRFSIFLKFCPVQREICSKLLIGLNIGII